MIFTGIDENIFYVDVTIPGGAGTGDSIDTISSGSYDYDTGITYQNEEGYVLYGLSYTKTSSKLSRLVASANFLI